jgi:mRNA interferase MazF
MNRGEVWWVDLTTTVGSEIQKLRPAVIVSANVSNRHMDRVQVIPVTSRVDRVYPSEAVVTVRGKKHKAMADQITTADKSRLKTRLGRLSQTDLRAVEGCILVQLGMK